jgi:hypothetical protein
VYLFKAAAHVLLIIPLPSSRDANSVLLTTH